MSDSKEPREWEIDVNCRAYKKFEESMRQVLPTEYQTVRVIERSAYDALKRELEQAKAELEKHRWRQIGAQVDPTPEAFAALKADADLLAVVLQLIAACTQDNAPPNHLHRLANEPLTAYREKWGK